MKDAIQILIMIFGLTILCAGCGSGSDNNSSNLSATQAKQIEMATFEAMLHSVLISSCAGCHTTSSNSGVSERAFFAQPSAQGAYDLIINNHFVNFSMPDRSALVVKALDNHNNCEPLLRCNADANAIKAGIEAWAEKR